MSRSKYYPNKIVDTITIYGFWNWRDLMQAYIFDLVTSGLTLYLSEEMQFRNTKSMMVFISKKKSSFSLQWNRREKGEANPHIDRYCH